MNLAAIILLVAAEAFAGPIAGPVAADVVSVYDGDTLTVDAHPWPGLTVRTAVRVLGIDTPEIRGKCEHEKRLAVEARDAATRLAGARVLLYQVEPDKYGGRVLAVVTGERGERLADALIAAGLARAYDGGTRQSWCGD